MASSPKVIIPMADYGHDPTETAVPYQIFTKAGFTVSFATESGKSPRCDEMMLSGVTGALLGAEKPAKKAYANMIGTGSIDETKGSLGRPFSWTDPNFSLSDYDLVFLPGGHEKGVRQLIDAEPIHKQLQIYFPLTQKAGSGNKKVLAAICHGVQVLAYTPDLEVKDKSIIHACKTTALPSFMESTIYAVTNPFLGDYYKTYGKGTPDVEEYVKEGLDDPGKQFVQGPRWWGMGTPMTVEDDVYRYVSGRFPPDAAKVAERAVEMVTEARAD
jgi:putative intracellular protease/amidase